MSQQPLFKREKPTVLSKRKEADTGNLAAARIILADRERYEGLQVEWAEAVVAKAKQNTGELF
jgi:hypothetical protein